MEVYSAGTLAASILFDPTYLNISYLFNQILECFKGACGIDFSNVAGELAWYAKILAGVVSVFAAGGIVWYLVKLFEVRAQYDAKYGFVAPVESEDQKKNERWENVLVLMQSQNPNDWRQAIIEADTMLDDITKRMGYDGETLGERLQTVEVSDFHTLDAAWEGHKVRNRIAHEGSAFVLTERDAKYTIQQFEKVFKEFGYI